MSRNQIKFKFSVKELTFEFEGDMEKGERLQRGIQESLGKLIHTPSRVLPPPNNGDVIDADFVANGKQAESLPTESSAQKSRRGARRPNRARGTSAAARIKGLQTEGYFAQERTLAEIQETLTDKGFTFEQNELSAAALTLVQKELLGRRKNDKGNYVYFEKVQGNGQGGNGEVAG